ncbi:hypothetical protein HN680_03430 [Candidatus Peregrinibacteria bacterium]|nr:hypothetical protein [Candidatus Peregrinibacteria bacterium]
MSTEIDEGWRGDRCVIVDFRFEYVESIFELGHDLSPLGFDDRFVLEDCSRAMLLEVQKIVPIGLSKIECRSRLVRWFPSVLGETASTVDKID